MFNLANYQKPPYVQTYTHIDRSYTHIDRFTHMPSVLDNFCNYLCSKSPGYIYKTLRRKTRKYSTDSGKNTINIREQSPATLELIIEECKNQGNRQYQTFHQINLKRAGYISTIGTLILGYGITKFDSGLDIIGMIPTSYGVLLAACVSAQRGLFPVVDIGKWENQSFSLEALADGYLSHPKIAKETNAECHRYIIASLVWILLGAFSWLVIQLLQWLLSNNVPVDCNLDSL